MTVLTLFRKERLAVIYWRQAASGSPSSVSYTHLVTYSNWAAEDIITAISMGYLDDDPDAFGYQPAAVSYTHLDVYKRQGLLSVNCRRQVLPFCLDPAVVVVIQIFNELLRRLKFLQI